MVGKAVTAALERKERDDVELLRFWQRRDQ